MLIFFPKIFTLRIFLYRRISMEKNFHRYITIYFKRLFRIQIIGGIVKYRVFVHLFFLSQLMLRYHLFTKYFTLSDQGWTSFIFFISWWSILYIYPIFEKIIHLFQILIVLKFLCYNFLQNSKIYWQNIKIILKIYFFFCIEIIINSIGNVLL